MGLEMGVSVVDWLCLVMICASVQEGVCTVVSPKQLLVSNYRWGLALDYSLCLCFSATLMRLKA